MIEELYKKKYFKYKQKYLKLKIGGSYIRQQTIDISTWEPPTEGALVVYLTKKKIEHNCEVSEQDNYYYLSDPVDINFLIKWISQNDINPITKKKFTPDQIHSIKNSSVAIPYIENICDRYNDISSRINMNFQNISTILNIVETNVCDQTLTKDLPKLFTDDESVESEDDTYEINNLVNNNKIVSYNLEDNKIKSDYNLKEDNKIMDNIFMY